MKKIVICIFLTIFFLVGNNRPAEATMKFDISRTIGTVSESIQGYIEDFNNALKLVEQGEQATRQGFSLENIKGFATLFRSVTGRKGAPSNLVTGTQGLAAAEEEDKRIAREKSLEVYREQWAVIAQQEIESLEGKIAELRKAISAQQAECNRLKNSETATTSEVNSCQNELQQMEKDIQEYEARIQQNKKDMEEAKKAAEAAPNDPQVERYAESRKKTESDTPEEETEVDTKSKVENSLQDAEWDTEDALEVYQVNNDEYQTFMKNYFYDPNLMATEKDPKNIGLEYENINNRITRNRKYLFINAAVHLMQVANTARREIPKRTDAVDAMFSGVGGSGELEADSAYGNTRIENARALLLYAKLLSAKLEYLAAHDLLKAEQTKELLDENGKEKEYENFDLNKYILTTEYLEKFIKKSNETLNFDESN